MTWARPTWPVLERHARPRELLAVCEAGLTRLITTVSNKQQGQERARQWLAAAVAVLELYGDHPAVALEELAAEVATEIRLLRAIDAELALHAAARERHYAHELNPVEAVWSHSIGPWPTWPSATSAS